MKNSPQLVCDRAGTLALTLSDLMKTMKLVRCQLQQPSRARGTIPIVIKHKARSPWARQKFREAKPAGNDCPHGQRYYIRQEFGIENILKTVSVADLTRKVM